MEAARQRRGGRPLSEVRHGQGHRGDGFEVEEDSRARRARAGDPLLPEPLGERHPEHPQKQQGHDRLERQSREPRPVELHSHRENRNDGRRQQDQEGDGERVLPAGKVARRDRVERPGVRRGQHEPVPHRGGGRQR